MLEHRLRATILTKAKRLARFGHHYPFFNIVLEELTWALHEAGTAQDVLRGSLLATTGCLGYPLTCWSMVVKNIRHKNHAALQIHRLPEVLLAFSTARHMYARPATTQSTQIASLVSFATRPTDLLIDVFFFFSLTIHLCSESPPRDSTVRVL